MEHKKLSGCRWADKMRSHRLDHLQADRLPLELLTFGALCKAGHFK
jgi:hypothetical protein